MRIGGFVRNSMVDWEGKVVSVVFTKGCNFRCGYCHNPSLVIPDLLRNTEDIPVNEVLSSLGERRGWIDGVVVTGGEPTIHNDLPDFLSAIKETGLLVKLDTNGTNPRLLDYLIEHRLTDFVAMDIKTLIEDGEYAIISGGHDHGLAGRIKESVELLRRSGIQYQFRTTIIPGYHTDEIIRMLDKEFETDPYIKQPFREGENVANYSSSSVV
jgi:pyruvate formate lyase activating enzyme